MSDPAPKPLVLEDSAIWKEACDIAEYMYGLLGDFPEEEKWVTASKLRAAANDLMYTTSQAVGHAGPAYVEYDWSAVRRQLAALKTMYRFAHRQEFIKVEPSMMNRLNALLKDVDAELQSSYEKTKTHNEEEQSKWKLKYAEWKEMES